MRQKLYLYPAIAVWLSLNCGVCFSQNEADLKATDCFASSENLESFSTHDEPKMPPNSITRVHVVENSVHFDADDGRIDERLTNELAISLSDPDSAAILKKATLIDIRLKRDASEFAIPGALKIPPESLRQRNFLRQQTLVLIGSGKDNMTTNQLAASLRRDGFKQVYWLRHGVRALRLSLPRQALLARSSETSFTLDESELQTMAQKNDMHWIVLGVTAREDMQLASKQTYVASLSYEAVSDAIKSARKQTPRQAIVLFSYDKVAIEWLGQNQHRFNDTLDEPLWFAGVEWRDIQAEREKRRDVLAQRGRPLQRPCSAF